MSEAARLFVTLDARITGLERGLARAQAQLVATRGAADKASLGIAKSFEARGRQMQQTGKSMTKWLTLPVIAGLAFAGKKAADFESQLSSLGSVSGATARQMAQFKKQAMDAGAATKFSALDAARAQTELAKGGLSVRQIMGGGLKSALALAAAGEMDLAAAAETTVNTMKQFGLEGRDSMKVADALATAANTTTADVEDFAMALKMGGSVAKLAGLSFNDTVVSLEALAEAGIKNSDAGTSLKSFLLNIATPSAKARKAMDDLGVSIFDSGGKLKSLPAISENLRRAFGDLTEEQFLNKAGTIAGSDAIRTLYALYAAGPQKLEGFAAANEKSGTAAEVAAKKQDNLKGKLEELQGSVETTAIAVGSALIPAATGLAQKVTPAINDVAQAFSSLPPEAQQAILAVLGLAAAVGPLTFVFGGALRGAAALIGPLGRLGGAARDVMLAFRAGGLGFAASTFAGMVNPLGLAAGAATVLAGAIFVLSQRESEEERIARLSTEAKRAQAAAVRGLTAAEREAAGAVVDSKRADIELARARQHRDELAAAGQKGTLEYRDAQLAVREASLRAADAHKREGQALHGQQVQRSKARTEAEKRLNLARRELKLANQEVVGQFGSPGSEPGPGLDKALRRQANAQRALTREQENAVRVNRRVAVSEANLVRESHGMNAILRRNRAGVIALTSQFGRVPKRVQTRLLLDDQDTVAKLGDASVKLRRLTSQRHVTKILADSKNADEALRRVKAELARIRDKNITIRATWSIPPAPNLRAPGNRGGGGGSGPGARTSRARSSAFSDQDVFGAGQSVEGARRAVEDQQARFETRDAERRGDALARRTDPDRLKGKKGDERKRIKEDIEAAKRELREFNQEMQRAFTLSDLEVNVTGAEQVLRAKQAIASLRDQMGQFAEEAAQKERERREKGIDDLLKSELAGIDESAEAQELKALREQRKTDQRAREDADQQKALSDAKAKLARAERSGSSRLIGEAQAEVAEAEQAISDTARDRREEELEFALDKKREEAQGRADTAREGLGKEMEAYKTHLQGQLDALVANLAEGRTAYAQFVTDVQAILAPLGGSFDGSAEQQAEIEPTAPTRPRRPRRRRPRRRATGGFVHEDFTIVGERGPELVSLPHGSRVHSAQQTERMMERGSSGTTVVAPQFHFHGRGPTAGQVIDTLGFMAERR